MDVAPEMTPQQAQIEAFDLDFDAEMQREALHCRQPCRFSTRLRKASSGMVTSWMVSTVAQKVRGRSSARRSSKRRDSIMEQVSKASNFGCSASDCSTKDSDSEGDGRGELGYRSGHSGWSSDDEPQVSSADARKSPSMCTRDSAVDCECDLWL